MLRKKVESFMNLKKSITWAVTGLFIFASALSAEEIKGDKTAGKTDARRLAKSGMADDGPTSTFFNINSWKNPNGAPRVLPVEWYFSRLSG